MNEAELKLPFSTPENKKLKKNKNKKGDFIITVSNVRTFISKKILFIEISKPSRAFLLKTLLRITKNN